MTAAAVLLAFVVAGCGSAAVTPSPTPISDPHQIIAQSLLNLERSHSLHVDGTIAGTVKMSAVAGMIGVSLPLSGNLNLNGSTITGDVDVSNSAAKVTVAFPSLFGLAVDLTEVDGYSYTKINLTDDKYTKSKTDVVALSSAAAAQASSGIGDATAQIRKLLDDSGGTATLTGHDKVDGRDVYQLDLAIPPDRLLSELRSIAPNVPADLTIETDSGTYWVYSDTFTPAKIELKATSSTLGDLDVTVTMTKYDQPVTIQAPPADKVK